MRALTVGVLAATAAVFASPATAAPVPVDIQFEAFAPNAQDVLPGETVEWHNVSTRAHTVTADDETFDSDDIEAGDRFEMTFDQVGAYGYHCRIHPGMVGEVDVRRVTLERLPPGLVRRGDPVEFEGRTADPSTPVQIERTTGGDFETVGTVQPNADGTWRTELIADETSDYRARSGDDVTQTEPLLVSDRRVIVRARGGRVSVKVVPANPYQRVVLELRLRERFGWWQQEFKRLDYLSRASFRVHRRVRARVSLVDKDGWTRLAISRVVRIRP
jgi:plastocyanin